jgi:hypothetical protein
VEVGGTGEAVADGGMLFNGFVASAQALRQKKHKMIKQGRTSFVHMVSPFG